MFRKLTLSAALVLAAVAGARALPSAPVAQPVEVVALNQAALPAPSSPITSAAPERVQLAPAQMQEARGSGFWRWLKRQLRRAWNWLRNHVSIRIQLSYSQTESVTETVLYDPNLTGDVTETHESTVTTDTYYASETDYNAGISSGSDYVDTGYQYVGTTCSGGGGGRLDGSDQLYDQMAMDVATVC